MLKLSKNPAFKLCFLLRLIVSYRFFQLSILQRILYSFLSSATRKKLFISLSTCIFNLITYITSPGQMLKTCIVRTS